MLAFTRVVVLAIDLRFQFSLFRLQNETERKEQNFRSRSVHFYCTDENFRAVPKLYRIWARSVERTERIVNPANNHGYVLQSQLSNRAINSRVRFLNNEFRWSSSATDVHLRWKRASEPRTSVYLKGLERISYSPTTKRLTIRWLLQMLTIRPSTFNNFNFFKIRFDCSLIFFIKNANIIFNKTWSKFIFHLK